MGITEHVEDLLLRQGAARLRDASEPNAPSDGYVAECPAGRAAIVRGGPVPAAELPATAGGRHVVISDTLAMCADVLHGAGLFVELAQDDRGVYLRVTTSP